MHFNNNNNNNNNNNKWSKNSDVSRLACRAVIEDWMILFSACRYWRRKYRVCYVQHSRNSSTFQWPWQSPQIAPSRGISVGPRRISIGLAVFALHMNVTSRQTNTHTDHATVAINRIWLLLRCGLMGRSLFWWSGNLFHTPYVVA